MRSDTSVPDYVETGDATFDSLYAEYSAMCRDEGVEPMSRDALLQVLRAVAMFHDGSESVTLH